MATPYYLIFEDGWTGKVIEFVTLKGTVYEPPQEHATAVVEMLDGPNAGTLTTFDHTEAVNYWRKKS